MTVRRGLGRRSNGKPAGDRGGWCSGGPAGIEALAATMGQERDTLEDVVEPFLLQIGFVTRTRAGRCATHKAYEHLGLTPPAQGHDAKAAAWRAKLERLPTDDADGDQP